MEYLADNVAAEPMPCVATVRVGQRSAAEDVVAQLCSGAALSVDLVQPSVGALLGRLEVPLYVRRSS